MEDKQKKLTPSLIVKALDYAYDKALTGFSKFDSAEALAESHTKEDRTPNENAQALIKWQMSKAGASGFLTSVGGLITLPVAIPANMASVLFIQVRMIAAIAHMAGYDLKDDKVKSLVYICTVGNGAKDLLKDIGIAIGERAAINLIQKISEKTITSINQRVGFKLLTKFGSSGAISLGKAVPLVGGVIGGTFDTVTTLAVGKAAKKTFLAYKA